MARAALLLVLLCVPVSANPVLETLINEFQVAPDSLERVELHPIDWMSLPFDLSGCRLVTSAGTAIIDTGIVIESESSFVVLGRANVTGPFGLADDSGPIVLLEDGNSWPLDSVFYAGSRTDWPWTPPPGTSSGLHTWMEYYPEPTRCFVWYIDSTPTFGSTNDDTASAIRGRILDPNSIRCREHMFGFPHLWEDAQPCPRCGHLPAGSSSFDAPVREFSGSRPGRTDTCPGSILSRCGSA